MTHISVLSFTYSPSHPSHGHLFLFSCHMYIDKIYKYVLHRKEYVRYLSEFGLFPLTSMVVLCLVRGVAVNMVFCGETDLEVFRCYIPRCGLPGPPGRSPFRLLRKIHADFHISSSLYSQQEGWFLSPSSSPMLVIFSQWWTSDQGKQKSQRTFNLYLPEGWKYQAFISSHLWPFVFFFLWEASISLAHLLLRRFGILMENPFVPLLSVQTWNCCSFREIIHFPHTLTFINTISHLFLEQNMNGFPLTFLYPTLTSKLIWVSFNFEKKKSYELKQLSLAFTKLCHSSASCSGHGQNLLPVLYPCLLMGYTMQSHKALSSVESHCQVRLNDISFRIFQIIASRSDKPQCGPGTGAQQECTTLCQLPWICFLQVTFVRGYLEW